LFSPGSPHPAGLLNFYGSAGGIRTRVYFLCNSCLLLHFDFWNAIVFLLACQGGENVAKSKTPAKRARVSEDNRLRNKAYKTRLKTAIKNYETSLDNPETARENLLQVTSLIDKSVTKGILHKNTAARKKSALARKFNQVNTVSE
jgi:small subunit ribosomal protein S20